MSNSSFEPSMEEILSSIKKIISDDTHKEGEQALFNTGVVDASSAATSSFTRGEFLATGNVGGTSPTPHPVMAAGLDAHIPQAAHEDVLVLVDPITQEPVAHQQGSASLASTLAQTEDLVTRHLADTSHVRTDVELNGIVSAVPPSSSVRSYVDHEYIGDVASPQAQAESAPIQQHMAPEPIATVESIKLDTVQHLPAQEASSPSEHDSLAPQARDTARDAFNKLVVAKALSEIPMPSSHDMHRIATEMLRPMVGNWLDLNLRTIVEKMVEQEIARIRAG
jgi:cell pole-organizing protein PopZ